MVDWLDQCSAAYSTLPELLRLALTWQGGMRLRSRDGAKTILRHAIPGLSDAEDSAIPSMYFEPGVDPLLILYDCVYRADKHSVFPVHPESEFLRNLIPHPPGERGVFLDVGSGSGLLGVCAARMGWQCVATDVSQRALRCTRLNAQLNHVHIDTKQCRGAEEIEPNTVDFCVANLPFETTPAGAVNYLHSDGGPHGHRVITEAAPGILKALKDSGRALFMSFSLLCEDRPLVEREFDPACRAGRSVLRAVLSGPFDIDLLRDRYDKEVWEEHRSKLAAEGIRDFVIELYSIGPKLNRPGRMFEVQLAMAEKSWVYPSGARTLSRAQ